MSSPDVEARVDIARLAEACAALVVAVARAHHAASPAVSLALSAPRRGGATLQIEPLPHLHGRVVSRSPDLGRGGMGLALPLTDLLIRAHGGTLSEQWAEGAWRGYAVRLPVSQSDPPRPLTEADSKV